jgi:hypothetical protein
MGKTNWETVLWGTIDRVIEAGRRYGMKVTVESQGNEKLKTAVPSTDCDKAKTTGERGIFQLSG